MFSFKKLSAVPCVGQVVTRKLVSIVAIICTAGWAVGCIPIDDPDKPPTAKEIFTGANISGANLGPGPAVVILNSKLVNDNHVVKSLTGEPGVCYTSDGSKPQYQMVNNLPFCGGGGGGATEQYRHLALLRCPSGADGEVNITFRILYLWKVGSKVTEQNASATYTIDCKAPPEGALLFDILPSSGPRDGFVEGLQSGSIYIRGGKATLDPDSGSLIYNVVVETTGDTHIIINSKTEVFGIWDEDPDEDPATKVGNLSWSDWVNYVDGNYDINPSGTVKTPFLRLDSNWNLFQDGSNDFVKPYVTNPRSKITLCNHLSGFINGCLFLDKNLWSFQKYVEALGSSQMRHSLNINLGLEETTELYMHLPIHQTVLSLEVNIDSYTRFKLKRYK